MFSKYYQEELQYLRELGRTFSLAHPALAPMLADRGGDPDVERLLEGVAFLTGRVREKLDDELPEIIHALTNLLAPQLLRPVPGATIVEVTPLAGALRDRRIVPSGAEFDSVLVDGTACRFRSIWELEMAPLEVVERRVEPGPGSGSEIRVTLRSTGGVPISTLGLGKLRFYLGGDLRDALKLRADLLEGGEVEVQGGGSGRRPMKGVHARPVGFEDAECLLPWGTDTLSGFRLVEEYFVFPHKFLFVDVDIKAIPADQSDVTLIFPLHSAPTEITLHRESLRLHCVPVVNLFSTTAEPIRLVRGQERYSVRPAGVKGGHGEVFAIQKIEGVRRAAGVRAEFVPFFSFVAGPSGGERYHYSSTRRAGVLGDSELILSIGADSGRDPTIDFDILSLDIVATNGSLTGAVRVGEVSVPTHSSPAFASFRNLLTVSAPVPVPLGKELQWRALSHMALGLRSLAETEVLRTALSVYNLQATVDRQAARANELRANAVEAVKATPMERIHRGAAVRGVDLEVRLREGAFSGDGDVHLFGSVLDRLYADYVSINTFTRVRVRGAQSNLRYEWPPRSGRTTLL